MINLFKGDIHSDERGKIYFDNLLDLSAIKRMYLIENSSIEIVRAWQGHKIESRWFAAVAGSFVIRIVKIDNWNNPSPLLQAKEYTLDSKCFNVLKVDCGYASSIQALEKSSKLLVMSNYFLGEVDDNYKFNAENWAK